MAAEYGSLPFAEQIAFFQAKVNTPTRTWTDLWRDGHDTGFMVAGAYKAELLGDLRAAVDKAIADGTTLESFRKDFDAIVAQHGWSYNGDRGWRTRVIYETNLRASYQAGRFAQLTDPDLLKTRPYWRYHHSESVRFPRPEHQAWNGLVLRHDDPWWQAHFPPNGWGCKCRVYAESERTLKRSGKAGPDSAPPTEFVSRRIGARGPAPRTVSVPKGIDPGWDYTPGRTVAPQVRAQIQARQATLPGPIAEQLGAELKRIPPTPAPPPPPAAVQTLSTVGDFEPDEIAKALAAVPGAADQVAKVGEFLQAHPQKALVIKKAEMGRGKAAQALTPSVATFLGTNEFRAAVTHTHPRPKDVNGWTRSDWEHFVVRAERGDRADDVDPRQLAELVEHVTSRATNGIPEWSMSGALAGLRGGKRAPLATLVHELGHQVHFWAGSPTPPTRASITRYATTNSYEWHAETFVAWLFNRDALMRWSRHAAEHLDNLLASAISNVRKR